MCNQIFCWKKAQKLTDCHKRFIVHFRDNALLKLSDVLHSKVDLQGHKYINHMNTDKTEQLSHTSMHEISQVNVCVSKVGSTFNKRLCLSKVIKDEFQNIFTF